MKNELHEKLRPCPFCQSEHTDHWTWISQIEDGGYMMFHYCKPEKESYDRVITVYGSTPEECVERWNADGKEHTPE